MRLPCPNPAPRCCEGAHPDWQRTLPAQWLTEAITPVRFTVHSDYEMPASRTLGYDIKGLACYYRHAFVLGETRLDDDEDFYTAIVHGEEVQAWRLRSEQWLVWSVIRKEGDCLGHGGHYRLSQRMPRGVLVGSFPICCC
jgi:hypothetical protein